MKKILTIVFVIYLSGVVAQNSLQLSLDEAIAYAVSHQPQLQNYMLDKEIASARNFESIAKYLPKLNGTVDLRDNLKLGEIALKFPDPLTGQEKDMRIQQGTKYSGTAGIDLNMPLLDMGAVSDIRLTKQQQMLSEAQLQMALIDVKWNVSRAYYSTLLNEMRMSKVEKSVQRMQKFYDDTKVRYDNQNAIKTELNRAYLNLENAKFQLKAAQDSVITSRLALLQVIGAPLESILVLTDKLPPLETVALLAEATDVKTAELNRYELRAELLQMGVGKMQLRKINWQYMPTLNGYGYIGGQGLANDNLFNKDKWFWTSYIGLRLNVPVFDGLQKAALAKQQKLAIQKSENNQRQIKNNIAYQVQSAQINYNNAAANVQLLKKNVALAEEIVADVNVRYNNGFATYQEVLDAENTLKETEYNYLQSTFAFLLAELEWKKANGKL